MALRCILRCLARDSCSARIALQDSRQRLPDQSSDARHHPSRSGQVSRIGHGGSVPQALVNRDQFPSPQADDEDGFNAPPDGGGRPEGCGDVPACIHLIRLVMLEAAEKQVVTE